MSQSEKAAYFQALKAEGVTFSKHYREYTTTELAQAYTELMAGKAEQDAQVDPELDEAAAASGLLPPPVPEPEPTYAPPPRQDVAAAMQGERPKRPEPKLPVAPANPNEMAGQRLNSLAPDEPIRVDESGLVWYQEEVRKPAFPKPRGRRVLDYIETGTKMVESKSGDYVETFEVAGDEMGRSAQVKITLPSYQVGIYKDKRFPFRIHIYNEIRGFDLAEVQQYYGGAELVPPEIKRMYVENVLCYDIRTTVRAIQTEYRQLQLAGRVQ